MIGLPDVNSNNDRFMTWLDDIILVVFTTRSQHTRGSIKHDVGADEHIASVEEVGI